MTLNRGLGAQDGVFDSEDSLKDAEIPNNRRVELVTGERYNVQATDLGGGLLLASGNYANPISSTDPQTAINTANISALDGVIRRVGGGLLSAGAVTNQLRDSGSYLFPLANTVPAGGMIIIELNDSLSSETPKVERSGSDLIRNNAGTDTDIQFVGAARITLTSDGVSEWEL